jgi:hemolysin activation/secretion protein
MTARLLQDFRSDIWQLFFYNYQKKYGIINKIRDVMLLLQGMKKMVLFMCVVLTLFSIPIAQAADRPTPTAGSILEETKRPDTNPTPSSGNAQIQVEPILRPPLVGNSDVKIAVNHFHITGQDMYSEQELLKLLPDPLGKELSLPEIEILSRSITTFLHKKGYIMAGVYVPEQQIKDGIVELMIVVGRYDQIVFRKKVDISDADLALQLGEVKSGAYIKKDDLERAIWLLGDLAGIEAKATLASGGKPGTANLYLDILPKGKSVSGDIGVDNSGNSFTGKNELFTDVTINNPFRQGDQFTINGIETAGNGLTNGSISYQMPLLTAGGTLEVGYSRLHYALGEEYASLDANGIADTTNLTYKYTFHRSRESNFYGQIGYVEKRLQDNVSGVATNKTSNNLVAGVNGDSFDKWGGGGINNYSLIYSHGLLNIQSSDALSIDAATAQTSGAFDKLNMTAQRHQYLNDRLTFMTLLSAQAANKNLDSSEKMSLGGANGVRSYPQGEAAGDEGVLLNCELRWSIPMKDKKENLLQLVGFFDAGSTIINKDPWPNASTPNKRTLMGAGLGVIWNNPGIYTIKTYYAWKVGDAAATSDTDRNGRLWVQCTSYF